MKGTARIVVSDVIASLSPDVKEPATVAYFGRPIANQITPFFYNRRVSANSVTLWRIVVAVAGLSAIFVDSWWGGATAAALFYVCFVLDCVDGNIARLRDEASYWGKFLDGLVDSIFVMAAPAMAGTALWLLEGHAEFMFLGWVITVITLTSQMVRNRLSFMREWMIRMSGEISPAVETAVAPMRRLQARVAQVYVNGTFFAPLLLLLPDIGHLTYLCALVLLQFLPEIVWLGGTLAEARQLLDRHRRSVRARV